MYPNATKLPDNLISRTSRLFVDAREFTDDNGKTVKYDRLVIEVLVKDEPVAVEFKLDKKDKLILSLADVVNKTSLRNEQE